MVDKYGFDFDGATYLQTTNNININSQYSFVISVKLTQDVTTTERVLVYRDDDNVDNFKFILSIKENNIIGCTFKDSDVEYVYKVINTIKRHYIGDEIKIGLVYNSGDILFIVNDEIINDSVIDSSISTNQKLTIGFGNYDLGKYSNQVFYNIKFFDSALTLLQLQSELEENNMQTIAYYPLNKDVLDYSGNNNNGTVTGTEQYALISEPYTPGIVAKKQKTYDITDKDYIIDYNYFFGGDFSIECDNSEIVKYGFDFDGNTDVELYNSPKIFFKDLGIYLNVNLEIKYDGLSYYLFGRYTSAPFEGFIYIKQRNNILTVYVEFTGGYHTFNYTISENGFHSICLFGKEVENNRCNISLVVNGVLIDSTTEWNNSDYIDFGAFYGSNYTIGGYITTDTNFKDFDNIISDFTMYNSTLTEAEAIAITSGSFDSTDNRIVFYESFSNETKGEVIGTEQYAIIEQRSAEQQFTIGFWNEAQQGFTFAGKQIITGNIAQFSYGETATRRMKIGITSEQPLTELTLTQEKLFDILVDSNGVSSGATTQDRFVNYNQVLNNSRTLTVRVKNEDYNFAQTLFKNKVYLDNEEWQISSPNVERLGLSHRKFNMSLQRLL